MSPSNFHESNLETKKSMNGPARPSPLKIHKDSHLIHKVPPSSNNNPSNLPKRANQNPNLNHNQRHQQPVIIYTHSPKIIHTEARDFMALVQKLTGLSRSDDVAATRQAAPDHDHEKTSSPESGKIKPKVEPVCFDYDCNRKRSDLVDNKGSLTKNSLGSKILSPSPYLVEPPLFTAGSANYYCAPPQPWSSMGSSLSPSFFEVMKGLEEY